ncbi:MAG: NAD-dependent epimerase/dehydratase family protein, partial [Nostocoides sp.]
MSLPSVLFLGGTGVISTECARYAAQLGHDVTVLNRGTSATHPVPEGVHAVLGDVRDADSVRNALGDKEFDVVVDFLSFVAGDVAQQVGTFEGRTGQYVFISSASAYQTPPTHLPVAESTPLANPFWQYSRDKIACEDLLVAAHRDRGLPMTIVRPSHTYDHTRTPFTGGWTVAERMRRGKPVIVPGDGSSRWTITHHTDFARAFVGLLGHPHAIGEAFHITGAEAPTWDQIHHDVAAALGVEVDIVHVTSDAICAADPSLTGSLIGDKSNSMIFDNSKIRTIVPGWHARVPFRQGAREIVDWHLADGGRQGVDDDLDALYDRLAATHGR